MKKSQALLTAALSAIGMAAGAGTAHAQSWTDGERRFHVSGRVQYDVASTDADFCNSTGTGASYVCESGIRSYVRRGFLGVDGRLTDHWRYNAKFDFSIGGSVNVDDFYLEYAGTDYSLIIGNNNAISPMEDRDSSLNIPFNERSFLISASGVGKRPGAAFITNGGNWSWGAELASNDSASTADNAANGTESWFLSSRFTWAPIYERTSDGITLLHLGLYGRYRDNGDGNGNVLNGLLSYSPNALSPKSNNNATVGGAESDSFWDGEVAFQWNAFGAEAEYGQINASDSSLTAAQVGDGDITGYYVDLFWSPTGEGRNYSASDGSFGGVSPTLPFGAGGIGHVMLSARYENLDMTDAAFGANRNETTGYTLGATWVPISHVKFQLNYSHTDVNYTDNVSDGDSGTVGVQPRRDNNINAVTFRTQFDW
jgi:phosphate-selective porin OprO/OprP